MKMETRIHRRNSDADNALDQTMSTRGSIRNYTTAGALVSPLKSCMVIKTQKNSTQLQWEETKIGTKPEFRSCSSGKSDVIKNKPLTVTFTDVEIRSHPIILGDNPAVSSGPPLTIDWDPSAVSVCAIDDYEKERQDHIRGFLEMKMPAEIRFQLLSQSHRTTEIAKRSKEMRNLRRQRLETTSMLYRSNNEEKIEKLLRGFRNLVTNKKKKEKKYMEAAAMQSQRLQNQAKACT
jgi:hypothetical protein